MDNREELIIKNIKLVFIIVNKYFKKYYKTSFYEDLFSEGYVGLVKAANSFLDDKNTKFSTYACICIENAIWKYLKNNRCSRALSEISLETKLNTNDDMILECITQDSLNIELSCIETETFDTYSEALQLFLISENDFVKNVFNEHIYGNTHKKIAKKLNTTPTHISRTLKKSSPKIKKIAKKIRLNNDKNKPLRSYYDSYEKYHEDFKKWYKKKENKEDE